MIDDDFLISLDLRKLHDKDGFLLKLSSYDDSSTSHEDNPYFYGVNKDIVHDDDGKVKYQPNIMKRVRLVIDDFVDAFRKSPSTITNGDVSIDIKDSYDINISDLDKSVRAMIEILSNKRCNKRYNMNRAIILRNKCTKAERSDLVMKLDKAMIK